MDEIPEDIWNAAEDVMSNGSSLLAIAQAIASERRRCADIYAEACEWDYFRSAEEAMMGGLE